MRSNSHAKGCATFGAPSCSVRMRQPSATWRAAPQPGLARTPCCCSRPRTRPPQSAAPYAAHASLPGMQSPPPESQVDVGSACRTRTVRAAHHQHAQPNPRCHATQHGRQGPWRLQPARLGARPTPAAPPSDAGCLGGRKSQHGPAWQHSARGRSASAAEQSGQQPARALLPKQTPHSAQRAGSKQFAQPPSRAYHRRIACKESQITAGHASLVGQPQKANVQLLCLRHRIWNQLQPYEEPGQAIGAIRQRVQPPSATTSALRRGQEEQLVRMKTAKPATRRTGCALAARRTPHFSAAACCSGNC